MSGRASDDTTIAAVSQVLWSDTISARAVARVIDDSPVAPTRL